MGGDLEVLYWRDGSQLEEQIAASMRKHLALTDDKKAYVSFNASVGLPENKDPEPSGIEGLADVRIIRALYRSAQTGHPEKLGEFTRNTRPSMAQEITRPAVREPELIHASSPSGS